VLATSLSNRLCPVERGDIGSPKPSNICALLLPARTHSSEFLRLTRPRPCCRKQASSELHKHPHWPCLVRKPRLLTCRALSIRLSCLISTQVIWLIPVFQRLFCWLECGYGASSRSCYFTSVVVYFVFIYI